MLVLRNTRFLWEEKVDNSSTNVKFILILVSAKQMEWLVYVVYKLECYKCNFKSHLHNRNRNLHNSLLIVEFLYNLIKKYIFLSNLMSFLFTQLYIIYFNGNCRTICKHSFSSDGLWVKPSLCTITPVDEAIEEDSGGAHRCFSSMKKQLCNNT